MLYRFRFFKPILFQLLILSYHFTIYNEKTQKNTKFIKKIRFVENTIIFIEFIDIPHKNVL